MNRLEIHKLCFHYPGGPPVLNSVTATVDKPELIAIIGPNGAGKSTLLDLIAGQRSPASGHCALNHNLAHTTPRSQFCRMVAHVPQGLPSEIPFTVEQVVLTGRIPYGRGLYESASDLEAMQSAIARTGLESFRHRRFSSLSGGEKQRVLLAAAVCQQSPLLLLDEPSAHLDPENECLLWDLLAELRASGHTIIVVTHHLALAAQYCSRIWLLSQGRLISDATPDEAMSPKRLEETFQVPFHRHLSPEGRVFLTYGR